MVANITQDALSTSGLVIVTETFSSWKDSEAATTK